MNLVVDASAAAEWVLQTPRGRRLNAAIAPPDLWAPELIDAEVLHVLRKRTLAGSIEVAPARFAIAAMMAWRLERLSHRPFLHLAFRFRNNLSMYDALYVAVAIATESAIVTVDGPLARANVGNVEIYNVPSE